MARRRVIPGALHNFLGTFASRYSQFNGYWLFGFLVENLDALRINLLSKTAEIDDTTPVGFARRLAVQKFKEQIEKAGLPEMWFREVFLTMTKSPERSLGLVNGRSASGYDLRFHVHVISDLDRAYDSSASVFVAPHDPEIELQSSRVI